MINGFEEQTHELTEYELTLVPLFVRGFSCKIGKANAVTSDAIIARMRPQHKLSGARVRKIVNYLRVQGILPNLMACSAGYYLTNDPEELASYIESLEQRANAIIRVKESLAAYCRQLKKSA